MARLTFNKKAAKYLGSPEDGHYNQSVAGNALKVTFAKNVPTPADISAGNVIARGQNFDYRENYQILPVVEWDTYFIQEIVLGMQELGTFGVQAMFSLRLNDAMPHVKTLPFESEMLIIQAYGRDSLNAGEVTNTWWGSRFSGRSSSQTPNGILMDNISGVYRYRLPGKEWKLANPSAVYPGNVQEVDLQGTVTPPVLTNN